MTPLGLAVIMLCICAGVILGKVFTNRRERKMKKILEDPHLLVEKLKDSGKIYDDGKELDIKVGIDNKTGKEVVVVSEKESKKAREIHKKNIEDKFFLQEGYEWADNKLLLNMS